MAISGYDRGAFGYANGLNGMNSTAFSNAVGNAKVNMVSNVRDYTKKEQGYFGWEDVTREDEKNYNANTINGQYVLSGKAGITPNFYNEFSNAFETYKATIKNDLKQLETNPNIKQAFRGTALERALQNLIVAVEQEANDYLFRLERQEKYIINSVKQAFDRQQSNMGSSMNSDTSKITQDNLSDSVLNSEINKMSSFG